MREPIAGLLGRVRRAWREFALLAALMLAVLAIPFLLGPRSYVIQCDGGVPTWMLPDDYDGGCVELLPGPPPADWDGSWLCTGLCEVPRPSPYYPDD